MLVERCKTVYKIDYSAAAENPGALAVYKVLNHRSDDSPELERYERFIRETLTRLSFSGTVSLSLNRDLPNNFR